MNLLYIGILCDLVRLVENGGVLVENLRFAIDFWIRVIHNHLLLYHVPFTLQLQIPRIVEQHLANELVAAPALAQFGDALLDQRRELSPLKIEYIGLYDLLFG